MTINHMFWVLLLFFVGVCSGDDKVEVNHSYSERLENSKSKVMIGFLLMILTPYFLWASEKQLVKYEKLVSRCQLAVREVANPFVVLRKLESLPVLVKGKTSTREYCGQVRDSELGYLPDVCVVRLKRVVEMYQWVESKKEEDKRTVYTYHQEWSECDIDSASFIDCGHQNPHRQPNTYSTVINADIVKIGSYSLIERQIDMMNNWLASPLRAIPSAAVSGYNHLHPHLEQPLSTRDGVVEVDVNNKGYQFLVFGGTLASPSIGTVRVRYEIIPEGRIVTTVGVQQRDTFRAFCEDDMHHLSALQCCQRGEECDIGATCACCSCCSLGMQCMDGMAGAIVGSDVLLLEERAVNVKTLFDDERRQLQCRMMLIRIVCYLLISLGIYFTLEPIATLLSFVPFLGGIISHILWIAAILLGCTFGMFVSSVAWVMYRPQILTGIYLPCDNLLHCANL